MDVINSGKALEKFKDLVRNQGGDVSYIENPSKFEKAKFVLPVVAEDSGFVDAMENEKIGYISCKLGAGRMKKDDSINYRVGVIINKKIGDEVKSGDVLGYIHADDEMIGNEVVKELKECYHLTESPVEKQKHILGILGMEQKFD